MIYHNSGGFLWPSCGLRCFPDPRPSGLYMRTQFCSPDSVSGETPKSLPCAEPCHAIRVSHRVARTYIAMYKVADYLISYSGKLQFADPATCARGLR